MEALSSVEAILIRATVSIGITSAHLRDVVMDTATQAQTGQSRAFEIEQCSCPPEYQGLSCEVSVKLFLDLNKFIIIFFKASTVKQLRPFSINILLN